MWRLLKPLLFASLALVAHTAFCTDNGVVSIDNQSCSSGDRILLTGSKTGYYYQVGKAVEQVAKEQCNKAPASPCIRICAKESGQTLDNILLLANKEVDFAIVQGDVAHDAWYGHPLPLGRNLPGEKKENIAIEGVKNVKLVTPLYVEAVHILLRPHLNITSLQELRGLKVWLGLPGSSTEYTATRVLRGAGFSLGKCESPGHRYEETDALVVTCVKDTDDFSNVMAQLKPGGLDALFKIGPVPTSDIERHLLSKAAGPDETNPKKSDYQLLPVDYDLASKFVEDGSYVYRLIQADDYGQAQSTLTIGVPALLLTNLSSNNADVALLAQLIRDNRRKIEEIVTHSIPKNSTTPKLSLDLLNVPVPVKSNNFVHEMAKPYLYHSSIVFHIIPVAVFVALCFLVAWFSDMTFRQFFIALLLGHSLIISLVLFGLACCGGALWLQQYEGSVNEGFRSFPISVWSTIRQTLPFSHSQMITPQGELQGSIVAWTIRLVFAFGIVRALKEKFGPLLKRWRSENGGSSRRQAA